MGRSERRLQEVLSGRGPADPGLLMDLIHQVNPTGLELPSAETERRYAQKAQLQGLLIRRFAADLRIAPEPGRDGFVRIDCRKSGRNACHARILSLDEEARAIVRRCLDEASLVEVQEESAPVGPSAPRRRPKSGPRPRATALAPEVAELLERGRQAQEEYDYEAAREHFAEALKRPGPAVEPARALLALLCECLAADEEALRIEAELPADALDDPEVRLLLAQAAARSGDLDRVEGLLKGLRRLPAAPILMIAARHALVQEDDGRAERLLGRAHDLDPACPELREAQAELVAYRQQALRPQEEQALRLLEEGDLAQAEERAGALLRRFPESRAGRRVLREVKERRAAAQIAALVMEAEAACARGAGVAALGLFQQALSAAPEGTERDRIAARAAELEQELRRQAEEQRLGAVAALLQQDLLEGLCAYAALEPRLRERLLLRLSPPPPEIGWFEELRQARPGDPAPVMAEAVLTLKKALNAPDPQEAQRLLSAHWKYLHLLPMARRVARLAEKGCEEQRRQVARQRLEELRACIDAATTDCEQAERLYAQLDLRALSEEDREAAASLRKWLDVQLRVNRHYDDHLKLFRDGKVHRAREELLASRALVDPKVHSFYHYDLVKCDAYLRVQHRLWVNLEPGPPDEVCDVDLTQHGNTPWGRQGVQQWLLPSGKELLLCAEFGGILLLRAVSVETGQVLARAILQRPALATRRIAVDSRGLWLLGRRGGVQRLRLPETFSGAADVPGRYPFLQPLPDLQVAQLEPDIVAIGAKEHVDRALLAPEAGQLWQLWTQDSIIRGTLRVVDAACPERQREIGERYGAIYIRGAEPMVVSYSNNKLYLHTPAGTTLREADIGAAGWVQDAAPHPSGSGLLVLAVPGRTLPWAPPEEVLREEHAVLVPISRRGTPGAAMPLPDTHARPDAVLATAPEQRLAFLRVRRPSTGRQEILALRAEEDDRALRLLYRRPVPRGVTLVSDAAGTCLLALSMCEQGLRAVPLGAEPPDLPFPEEVPELLDADVYRLHRCFLDLNTRPGSPLPGLIKDVTLAPGPQQFREAIDAYLERERERPEHVALVVMAIENMKEAEAQEAYIQRLKEEYGDDPHVRLWLAHLLVTRSRFPESTALLRGLRAEALEPALAAHLHHLRATIALSDGRLEETWDAVHALRACPSAPCDPRSIIDLATPLPEPLRETDWGPGQPLIRRLHGAVVTADLCLVRGDAKGAIRALDRRPVWMAREVQALGRLTEAWLQRTPQGGPERFRKYLSVLAFAEALVALSQDCRNQLPYPGRTFSLERLEGIRKRGIEWLVAAQQEIGEELGRTRILLLRMENERLTPAREENEAT